MRRPSLRSLAGGAAGFAAGVAGGVVLASVSAAGAPSAGASAPLEAAHLPPVLTLPGEPVTLRYAVVCAPREDGLPCQGSGDVHVRAGQDGLFRKFALERGDDSKEGRYFVDLPGDIAGSPEGFSYYAVLRDDTGASVTLPSGGAAAPQRSFPFRQAVDVDLGPHTFGRARVRDSRVLEAKWGGGVGEVGLFGSRQLGFVGPASFDVGRDGAVTLLDQVNGRAQRWVDGRATATPLAVSAGLADFAVERDGTIDVLEPADRVRPEPVLRTFRSDGTPKWAERLSDRTWAKLEVGPDGPVVQQQPSEQWLPTAAGGTPLGRKAQAQRGRPGRPLGHGRELVVQRVGAGELRLAELAGNAITRAWRIRSATPLGEVPLAGPLGGRIVTVVKTYTDDRDEFLVLQLGRTGLAQRFAVAPAQWAESAPLARFRLRGSSLYQLGSSPAGAFVDRFDLEVSR
jgi:hypothetical protein